MEPDDTELDKLLKANVREQAEIFFPCKTCGFNFAWQVCAASKAAVPAFPHHAEGDKKARDWFRLSFLCPFCDCSFCLQGYVSMPIWTPRTGPTKIDGVEVKDPALKDLVRMHAEKCQYHFKQLQGIKRKLEEGDVEGAKAELQTLPGTETCYMMFGAGSLLKFFFDISNSLRPGSKPAAVKAMPRNRPGQVPDKTAASSSGLKSGPLKFSLCSSF